MKKLVTFIILLTMTFCLLCSLSVSTSSESSLLEQALEAISSTVKKGFKYGNLPKDFYEDEEVLLSTDDKYSTKMYSCTPEKSRMNIDLKDFKGFRTMAYFYKYND